MQISDKLSVKEIKDYLGISADKRCDIIKITPEQASMLLEFNNTNNRKISKGAVALLKNQINKGEFCLSNDFISFNNKGVLTNGQHRLKAIAESKVEATETGVVFGVEHFMAMDTGKKRSLVDNAMIFEDCDERLLEASRTVCFNIAKTSVAFMRGYYSTPNYTPKQYSDIVNYLSEPLLICFDSGLFSQTKGLSHTAVLSAFFLAYLNGVPLSVLVHIKEILTTGVATRGDLDKPIISLRDKLLLKIKGGGRENSTARFCYTASCIEKVAKKKTSLPKGDKFIYTYQLPEDLLK